MRKIKKWKLIKEENVSPDPWFPLYKHVVKLPSGKIINDYYISKLGNVAMIVAVTKDKKIIFVRQYKHGADEVIIELPAGRVEKGRNPIDCAKQELTEETGYIATKLISLGNIYFEPSKDTLKVYGFITGVNEVTKHQSLEVTEDIEVLLIPAKDVDKWIKSGKIKSSDTLAFLKLAQLKFPAVFI